MKSRPVGTDQSILASQNNDKRDDARASSFLLAHQQLGALSLGTSPTNGQVIPIVINGTTITVTAVTTIGSTPNNVLISGGPQTFVTNLVNFLRRPDLTTSTQVAASGANQTLLQYVGWAWPASATTIVPFSLNKNVNGLTGPLTSFNITGITVTSGTWTAQTMQLYVEDGTYYINGTRYLFTGASTPTVTAPSSHPRIDLLTIDTSGTLAWTAGTEASSPTTPTYPANKLAICELYNVVSETALYDNENLQSGEGYISNDVRPAMSYGPVFGAVAEDLIPDAADTRNLGSSGYEWNNLYAKTIYRNGLLMTGSIFGGTGSDGALTITSGTTTVSLGNAAVVVKNYSSISITGTGALAFSNPNTNGTIIIIKCQGACTITSTATSAIVADGMGASGGASTNTAGSSPLPWLFGAVPTGGGIGSTSGNYGGPGGGGASVANAGSAGGTNSGASGGAAGAITGVYFTISRAPFIKACVMPGAGGASGTYNYSGTVGTGGAGGGGLYIEVAGAFNFGSGAIISAKGTAGTSPTGGSNCGAGGGGGGGVVVILYNTLTANSGTVSVTGGAGGTGGGTGGAGGAGTSYVGVNTEF